MCESLSQFFDSLPLTCAHVIFVTAVPHAARAAGCAKAVAHALLLFVHSVWDPVPSTLFVDAKVSS